MNKTSSTNKTTSVFKKSYSSHDLSADRLFHAEFMRDEPAFNEYENEFIYLESPHAPKECSCGKPLDDSAYYGGKLYKQIENEANILGRIESMNSQSIWIEACKGDLYCIALYYTEYFEISNHMVAEEIDAMNKLLDFGIRAGFWLAYCHKAYFIEDIRNSKFKEIFGFEESESPISLMRLARDKYTKLHPLLSDLSKRDIDKEIMLMSLRG